MPGVHQMVAWLPRRRESEGKMVRAFRWLDVGVGVNLDALWGGEWEDMRRTFRLWYRAR